MSCKSMLYAANTTPQVLLEGANISFGNAIRRFGKNVDIIGGNVVAEGAGYYKVDANVTVTAGGAGTGTVTLYKDGSPIPGAVASFTAAAGDIYNVSIAAVVRDMCCYQSTITAVLSGIAGTVGNASIVAEKL